MNSPWLTVTVLFAMALVATPVRSAQQQRSVVLRGATLVDVSDFGRSDKDVTDATIVVHDGRILAVGNASTTVVPDDAQVLDVTGKYLVPGFIDGYCGMNSQGHANAFLYLGVTSIVAKGDSRRGRLFVEANPSPRIFEIAQAGVEIVARTAEGLRQVAQPQKLLSEADTLKELDAHARRGIKVLHLLYPLTPDRVRLIVQRGRELGMVTVAELGATSYAEALEIGVHSFVHTGRYSFDLAPREWVAEYSRDSFGSEAARRYYDYLDNFDVSRPALDTYAKLLAKSRTGLMPTASLGYPSFPDHRNLWEEPAAAILDPKTLHAPMDRETGRPWVSPQSGQPLQPHQHGAGERLLELDRRYYRAGARFLAGTACSALGTMPGISLHTELELLTRAGLSPREALAAATWNFREIYGWSEIGQITPGAWADIVVLDRDPTDAIVNAKSILLVLQAGEVIDRARLLAKPTSP